MGIAARHLQPWQNNGICSFGTFADSRADVTKERTWHAGRCAIRNAQQSAERAHLEAVIRDMRGAMEGPKGGSNPHDKYHLPKAAVGKRWQKHVADRRAKGLPVIGSQSLFEKLCASCQDLPYMALIHRPLRSAVPCLAHPRWIETCTDREGA